MEIGHVVEVFDNKIKVSLKRTEACAKCRACTAGFEQSEMFIIAKNECGAKSGDFVNIELDSVYFFRAVLIMYLIPLVTLVLGFVFGEKLTGSELMSFIIGIAFLLLTYFGIKVITKNMQLKKYIPVATGIVNG